MSASHTTEPLTETPLTEAELREAKIAEKILADCLAEGGDAVEVADGEGWGE